jgi:hypothetical protein
MAVSRWCSCLSTRRWYVIELSFYNLLGAYRAIFIYCFVLKRRTSARSCLIHPALRVLRWSIFLMLAGIVTRIWGRRSRISRRISSRCGSSLDRRSRRLSPDQPKLRPPVLHLTCDLLLCQTRPLVSNFKFWFCVDTNFMVGIRDRIWKLIVHIIFCEFTFVVLMLR